MKIYNIYSGCKHAATINIICRTHGQIMSGNEIERIENLVRAGTSFLVLIDLSGVSIIEMRERSEMLAKIVSKRVKNSSVLFFHDGAVREFTGDNALDIWRLIAPIKKIELSDKVEFDRYQKTAFDICKAERPYKKMSKRGFSHRRHACDSMERIRGIMA